jgi:hypothetical protein
METLSLFITANVVPNPLIPSTLMMEVTHSSEASVRTGQTRNHMTGDRILYIYRCENL